MYSNSIIFILLSEWRSRTLTWLLTHTMPGIPSHTCATRTCVYVHNAIVNGSISHTSNSIISSHTDGPVLLVTTIAFNAGRTYSSECPIWRRPGLAFHRREPVPWLLLLLLLPLLGFCSGDLLVGRSLTTHAHWRLTSCLGVFLCCSRCVLQHLYTHRHPYRHTTKIVLLNKKTCTNTSTHMHNTHTHTCTPITFTYRVRGYNFRRAAQITVEVQPRSENCPHTSASRQRISHHIGRICSVVILQHSLPRHANELWLEIHLALPWYDTNTCTRTHTHYHTPFAHRVFTALSVWVNYDYWPQLGATLHSSTLVLMPAYIQRLPCHVIPERAQFLVFVFTHERKFTTT